MIKKYIVKLVTIVFVGTLVAWYLNQFVFSFLPAALNNFFVLFLAILGSVIAIRVVIVAVMIYRSAQKGKYRMEYLPEIQMRYKKYINSGETEFIILTNMYNEITVLDIPTEALINNLAKLLDIVSWAKVKELIDNYPYLISGKSLWMLDVMRDVSLSETSDDQRYEALVSLSIHSNFIKNCLKHGIDSVFSNPEEPAALYRIVKGLENKYRNLEPFEKEIQRHPELLSSVCSNLLIELKQNIRDKETIEFLEILLDFQEDAKKYDFDAALGRLNIKFERKISEHQLEYLSKISSIPISPASSMEEFKDGIENLMSIMAESPLLKKQMQNILDSGDLEEFLMSGKTPDFSNDPYHMAYAELDKVNDEVFNCFWQARNPLPERDGLINRVDQISLALEKCNKSDAPFIWAVLNHALGQAFTVLNNTPDALDKAIQCHLSALEVFSLAESPYLWSLVKHDLGICYYERAVGDKAENIEKAIDCFEDALKVRTRDKFPSDWQASTANLAAAQMSRVGKNEKEGIENAILIYEQLLEHLSKQDSPQYFANAHNNAGMAWFYKANYSDNNSDKHFAYSQSIKHYELALQIYTEDDLPEDWAMSKMNLGNSLSFRSDSGDMITAKMSYQDALRVYVLEQFPVEWAKTKLGLGYMYWRLNELDESIAIYSEMEKNCTGPHLLLFRVHAAGALGVIYHEQKDWKLSYDHLKISLQSANELRLDMYTQDSKIYFNRTPSYYHQYMVKACIELNLLREAFEYAESGKSRLFLEQLATDSSIIAQYSNIPRDFWEIESMLLEELRHIENKLSDDLDRKESRLYTQRQEEIVTRLKEIWSDLETEFPIYASLRRGTPISYEQIIEFLNESHPRAAIVEYYDVLGEVIAFIVRPDRHEPILIDTLVDKLQVKELLGSYIENMAAMARFDVDPAWEQYSSKLFGELTKHLKDIDVIFLVPHGYLHLIPFYALKLDDGHVLDKFTLVYAPSANTLTRVHDRRKTRKNPIKPDVMIIGNPTADLAYSRIEAQEINKYLGGSIYLGARATKEKVFKEAPSKDILHFACHGDFDHFHPMRSGLMLADNEVLTANEIMGMSLNADLVCLSACMTGLNRIGDGDELSGLSRAFLYAGATSVLVSLWPVHDEATASLMSDFYQGIAQSDKNESKSFILRQTMIAARSKNSNPYFWAPFIMVGGL